MSGFEISVIIAACSLVVAAGAGGLAVYRNAQIETLQRAVNQLTWDVGYERSDKEAMRKEFEKRLNAVCQDYERQIAELRQQYEERIHDLEAQAARWQGRTGK